MSRPMWGVAVLYVLLLDVVSCCVSSIFHPERAFGYENPFQVRDV